MGLGTPPIRSAFGQSAPADVFKTGGRPGGAQGCLRFPGPKRFVCRIHHDRQGSEPMEGSHSEHGACFSPLKGEEITCRRDLTDAEWRIVQPLLPNTSQGVPRGDDRRVRNGILRRFRTGSPWRDMPGRCGPRTTCYNRFVRWRAAGLWDRIPEAIERGPNRGDASRVAVASRLLVGSRTVDVTEPVPDPMPVT